MNIFLYSLLLVWSWDIRDCPYLQSLMSQRDKLSFLPLFWCSRHNLPFLQGWTSFNISVTEASKASLSALMSFEKCRYFIKCSTLNCQLLVNGIFFLAILERFSVLLSSQSILKHLSHSLTHTFIHWWQGANRSSGAIWGSVSCSRTLRHAAGGSRPPDSWMTCSASPAI